MNYTTYFSRGQKVFLINISPDRDETIFEAFSATITSCTNKQLEVRTRYPLHHGEEKLIKEGMLFKVTAESFGSGVQFSGQISALYNHGFSLVPVGPIEMYQRSQVPRLDITTGFSSFTRIAPLVLFQHEWRRLQEGLRTGKPDNLALTPTQLNLGIGGLRSVSDQSERQNDLAMVFIELEPEQPPVCAVVEQLWRRTLPDDEGVAIGQRFVLIRKQDQTRIQHYIEQILQKQGKKLKKPKNNWELLDRMFRNH